MMPIFILIPVGVVWATPLAPPRGFEPRTLELTALCSAAELRGKISLIEKSLPTFQLLNHLAT